MAIIVDMVADFIKNVENNAGIHIPAFSRFTHLWRSSFIIKSGNVVQSIMVLHILII